VNGGLIAKSVTEKNNRRVDCAEADKKTVQAQRNEGRGFLAAGDCPDGASHNELSGENLTAFSQIFFLYDFLPISPTNHFFTFEFQKIAFGCGVSVAEGIKTFTVKDCSDFTPQLT
jgi:hypothetical protein